MGDIKLLDCTLRDGGYINDWKFGHDNLVSIFERSVDAGVDIIEIGFLDERREFDIDRSIMPDTDCVSKIYGALDRKKTMVVGMIDYGTCGIEHIKPCSGSFLDGIRVIFKKHLREQAMSFCGELKKLGYKVFAQLVSVTSYTDEEMLDLIRLANDIRPYAVSMVDTYGLMHQDNLIHFFNLLNDNLIEEIGLGYHAHNNFQMGYANCIAMLSNNIKRMMVVDGSIYGMGKSAGNAPIELIAMHLNNRFGKHYHISQFLEAIDSNISQFYTAPTWGYNMFYYLAASNDCHPNYVAYLMDKRTLSIKQINELLARLGSENKLLYAKDYIEKLYAEYITNDISDDEVYEALKCELSGKKLLIIGPGGTVKSERNKIKDYIGNDVSVISINYIPDDICPDYVFLSNSKRYVQNAVKLIGSNIPIIATSNLTDMGNKFKYVLNNSKLLDFNAEIIDVSLVMILKVLIRLNISEVLLAGFDGYSQTDDNYFNLKMEYDFVKSKAEYLNGYISDFIVSVSDIIKMKFITSTRYTQYLGG